MKVEYQPNALTFDEVVEGSGIVGMRLRERSYNLFPFFRNIQVVESIGVPDDVLNKDDIEANYRNSFFQ